MEGRCTMWDLSTGARLWEVTLPQEASIHGVGGRVPKTVCWGRDWFRQQVVEAFAMGKHARLGVGSYIQLLDEELMRMVVDMKV
jgi:hypothetical protein